MKALQLLAIAALAAAPFAAVAADSCLYDCQGPICSDFANKSSMCTELRAKCQARCSGRRLWGALAYSAVDKGFGWSTEWNDVNQAKKDAMDKCRKTGKACKLWAWFENECGAVAADGNTVTWGTAANRTAAQQRALEECRKAGGRNCAVEVWACSKIQ